MSALLALTLLLSQDVSFAELPKRGQLFPRDAQDQAVVEVAGLARDPSWHTLHLTIWADGDHYREVSHSLQFTGNKAPFRLSAPIAAGRVRYAVTVQSETLSGRQTIAHVDHIVCGDAYLVQGQSNAVARDQHGEGAANRSQSYWVRSFGTASRSSRLCLSDNSWYIADGLGANDKGTIGAWALRMGDALVENTGVPVAIINGAVGGTSIAFHLPNGANREDTSTNYGRLLTRVSRAGLGGNIRAIIWYQGESDGDLIVEYVRAFRSLYHSWSLDFRGFERAYVVQVRPGCGDPGLLLREE